MADRCTCQQCRLKRELFGNTTPTKAEQSDAVWSLALVLGDQLASFDETALAEVLEKVAVTRNGRMAQSRQRVDLARTEVAGHG